MIELGDRVQDKISGLKGIIVAITNWLYGCTRVIIQPEESKDGKPSENYTIDEPQCKLLKKAVIEQPIFKYSAEKTQTTTRHGNRQNTTRATDPTRQ